MRLNDCGTNAYYKRRLRYDRAEIEADNVQAQKLADENHAEVAQNVAAGVVGVVIWPVWFAMDAKGAAGTEMDALAARQQCAPII